MPKPEAIAERVWLLRYPLRLFGMEMGRNVTLLGLEDGRLAIHSTAPFSTEDIAAIESIGKPGWILDATCFHDTFREHAPSAFPSLPYLAPEGFPGPHDSLDPLPEDWGSEIEGIEIAGIPKLREHVFFHRASGTLVVADLLFNQPPSVGWWTRNALRALSGIREHPGNSRMFRLLIRDRSAFDDSIQRILDWPIERIVVGHGDPIEKDAKETLRRVFSELGSPV